MSFANCNGSYKQGQQPTVLPIDYKFDNLPLPVIPIPNQRQLTIYTSPALTIGRLLQINYTVTVIIPRTSGNPSISIVFIDTLGNQQQLASFAYPLNSGIEITSKMTCCNLLLTSQDVSNFKVNLVANKDNDLGTTAFVIEKVNICDLGEYQYSAF